MADAEKAQQQVLGASPVELSTDQGVTSTFDSTDKSVATFAGEGTGGTISADDLAAIAAGDIGSDKLEGEEGKATEGELDASSEKDGTDGDEADTLDGDADKAATDAEPLPEDFEGDLTDELVTKYVNQYSTPDASGNPQIDLTKFNAEADTVRKREDGTEYFDLNKGTKKWLNSLGFPDSAIQAHLEGYHAKKAAYANEFHSNFGATPEEGARNYEVMRKWAAENYTPEQRSMFNEGFSAAGQKAQDQIALLKVRYTTANPGGLKGADEGRAKAQTAQLGLQRRNTPARSATAGKTVNNSTAQQTFANAGEHRVAMDAAMKMSGSARDKALADVSTRLKASTFWRKQA